VSVAQRIGAPSGSIYHRFASRDVMAASLWLRTVERFQVGWSAAAVGDDPVDAARAAARYVITWSRDNLVDAQILLVHRSTDLLTGAWPEELVRANREQRSNIERSLLHLSRRLGAFTKPDQRRVIFAVIDIPYGAVRQSLSRGRPPTLEVEQLVDDAVCGVLAKLTRGDHP
jgi:AcrR family transcriptional regulator